ncbi:hypothetical protein H072_3521 [Dactylellina haptotyla CBS 200.50]|uniref:Uncharacterized protein n=1 Tax=Dactylellina haptotyla (strain CBS 200.50) TaxID=1284197 RepID=S8C4A1_DACHA|nr:hypothetical protein H072_3521 [Dactylellina haptotyla CBS 200.50]
MKNRNQNEESAKLEGEGSKSLPDEFYQELILTSLVYNRIEAFSARSPINWETIAEQFKFKTVREARQKYSQFKQRVTAAEIEGWRKKVRERDEEEGLYRDLYKERQKEMENETGQEVQEGQERSEEQEDRKDRKD